MWSANLRVRVHLRMCVCSVCVSACIYASVGVSVSRCACPAGV